MTCSIRIPARFVLIALMFVTFGGSAAVAVPPGDDEAAEAAAEWLALMDAGEYAESWSEAGEAFRSAVSADEWAKRATAVRQQVGDMVSRGAPTVERMSDPPGARPGEYAQVRYASEFAGAGNVTEIVVLADEADRGWRVVGYFLQPPGS